MCLCLCERIYTRVCSWAWGPDKTLDPSELTGVCEVPDMGAGIWTLVLMIGQQVFSSAEPFLQPCIASWTVCSNHLSPFVQLCCSLKPSSSLHITKWSTWIFNPSQWPTLALSYLYLFENRRLFFFSHGIWWINLFCYSWCLSYLRDSCPQLKISKMTFCLLLGVFPCQLYS